VGIHDDSHFVRDFERVYGMSPRTFRRAREGSVTGEPGEETGGTASKS